jgi:hypothetical protein
MTNNDSDSRKKKKTSDNGLKTSGTEVSAMANEDESLTKLGVAGLGADEEPVYNEAMAALDASDSTNTTGKGQYNCSDIHVKLEKLF